MLWAEQRALREHGGKKQVRPHRGATYSEQERETVAVGISEQEGLGEVRAGILSPAGSAALQDPPAQCTTKGPGGLTTGWVYAMPCMTTQEEEGRDGGSPDRLLLSTTVRRKAGFPTVSVAFRRPDDELYSSGSKFKHMLTE